MHKIKNSLLLVTAICGLIFSGCSKKQEKRLVIWTDNSEFASYIEIYNEYHKNKAVLIYKDNLAASLPPMRDELHPDLIVGTWLRNSKIKKNFEPIDFLFERNYLSSSDFYETLLSAGKAKYSQYLLPVSFNIPAVIYSKQNKDLVDGSYSISLDQLKTQGAAFNKKNKKGVYTSIGFAPQSNDNFLYVVTKMKGAGYTEEKNGSFTWNQDKLQRAIAFLNQWISEVNTSAQTESDFVYKYLTVKDEKKVTGGKTLFAYITSDRLFQLPKEQISKLEFRWLENDGLIPVEDSLNMMGISKNSVHQAEAVDFISWFFKSETQRLILDKKARMNLDNSPFGIAGGFSTIKDINDYILPVYYKPLLTNIPQAGTFSISEKRPANWETMKARIIIPYIKDSITAVPGKKNPSIEERYSEFKKLGY
ncbi:MAG: extracellular solute-binding protein [Spirochaetia bacterium]|nr:extracellular solute-binding protein [Spirochaetia bacterium]